MEKTNSRIAGLLVSKLAGTQTAVEAIVKAADNGGHFDQQITPGNKAGNKRLKPAISALRSQTGDIEAAARAVGVDRLGPESSDAYGG